MLCREENHLHAAGVLDPRVSALWASPGRGGHRHLQIGRMLDIDLISEPPPPPRPLPSDVCIQSVGIGVARGGRKRFLASWGLRMSHICQCTPCPSPQGSRSKVESRHFAHRCRQEPLVHYHQHQHHHQHLQHQHPQHQQHQHHQHLQHQHHQHLTSECGSVEPPGPDPWGHLTEGEESATGNEETKIYVFFSIKFSNFAVMFDKI